MLINNECLNFKFKYCKYENHCAEYEIEVTLTSKRTLKIEATIHLVLRVTTESVVFPDTTNGDDWYNLISNGDMSTVWKSVDGSWYYFNLNGSMASNKVIDGYRLGTNGKLIK